MGIRSEREFLHEHGLGRFNGILFTRCNTHTYIYIYVSVSTKTRQGVIESEFFAFPFSGKQSLPEFLKL